MQTRPVLIVGPLADAVANKLISDQPHKFVRCQPDFLEGEYKGLILINLGLDDKIAFL